jgi:hypothetical protein
VVDYYYDTRLAPTESRESKTLAYEDTFKERTKAPAQVCVWGTDGKPAAKNLIATRAIERKVEKLIN